MTINVFPIIRCTKESKNGPKDHFVYMMEEVGELATEIHRKYPSCIEYYKDPGKDGILGEAVDTIICALAVFFSEGGDEERLQALINDKCIKWFMNMNDTNIVLEEYVNKIKKELGFNIKKVIDPEDPLLQKTIKQAQESRSIPENRCDAETFWER